MKVALLVFLSTLFTRANGVDNDESVEAFKECLHIDSFYWKDRGGKIRGQCLPSKHPGAFYTVYGDDEDATNRKALWQCLDKGDAKDLGDYRGPQSHAARYQEKHAKDLGYTGICKFHSFEAKLKKEHVELCTEKPLQCAPGPKNYWGACVSRELLSWSCIPQDEDVISSYVKGDCMARPVENSDGQVYHSVCRFATEKDAEYPKPVKCPTVPTYESWCEEVFKSACFSTKTDAEGKAIPWSCRKLEDQESSACEWTVSGSKPESFFEGECLLETHEGYEKAQDWAPADGSAPAPVEPKAEDGPAPAPVEPEANKAERGGIGTGSIALLVLLMLAAGVGGFLFWQRRNQAGPRALTGGLVR